MAEAIQGAIVARREMQVLVADSIKFWFSHLPVFGFGRENISVPDFVRPKPFPLLMEARSIAREKIRMYGHPRKIK